jgi:hypothetical protein
MGGGMVNLNFSSQLTPLQHLQDRFAIIDLSGSIRLVDHHQIKKILDSELKCDVSYYQKSDGNLMMLRHLESLPLPCTPKKVVEDFWSSPKTHQYNVTAFDPRPTPLTTLNFWIGHAPDPKPGNWVVIRNYLLNVLCNNDHGLYDYLIRYLAHMITRPEEKPGVMIVLIGGQGTGKGVFFTLLRAIWPMTTLQVSKIDQVVGKFTSALERNYIICMDEALFAGDRQAIDNLKSTVSEQYLHIEQKYQPSRTIESMHRLFAATNHEHFAHVEPDDRRFVFIRVSDVHQQDTRYFSAIAKAIADAKTIKSLIYYLQSRDLSNFNVRSKPITNEQLSQKIKSLQGFERFWYEVLCSGNIKSEQNNALLWNDTLFVSTTYLVKSFKEYHKAAEKYQPLQESQVLETLKKICPKVKTGIRELVVTNYSNKEQRRGVRLPCIQDARQDFCKYIGHEISWGEIAAETVYLGCSGTDLTPT